MARFPEAEARLFHNKFICKKCKSVIRSPSMLVMQDKVKCRRCHSRRLRSVKKK